MNRLIYNTMLVENSPYEILTQKPNVQDICDACNLTLAQKQLIIRYFVNGEKQNQIAISLGIGQPAVHKRLIKIYRKIKKTFNKSGDFINERE